MSFFSRKYKLKENGHYEYCECGECDPENAHLYEPDLLKKKRLKEKNDAIEIAKKHEKLLEFEEAAQIYKKYEMENDVIRVREYARNKIEQTVVQGNQITKTEIKDSVLNRSNIGGGSSKMQELKDLAEMKKEGLISDEEYEKMKQEIIG